RQGVNPEGDDPTVHEFMHGGVLDHLAADALADVVLSCGAHLQAEIEPMLDQRADRGPRLHPLGRKPVDLAIACVAEHDLAVALEDDDPERQLVDRPLEEARTLGARRLGRRFVEVPHTPSPAACLTADHVREWTIRASPGERLPCYSLPFGGFRETN